METAEWDVWAGLPKHDPDNQLAVATHHWAAGRFGRTGQRNRPSAYISEAQYLNAYAAVAYANYLGFVLNASITVSWSTLGVVDDDAVARANSKLVERFRKFLAQRNVGPAWLWVIENGERLGLHTHMLAHVPRVHGAAVRRWAEEAVETISGAVRLGSSRRGTDDTQLRSLDVQIGRDDKLECDTQWRRFRYMMKGVDPDAKATPRGLGPMLIVDALAERAAGERSAMPAYQGILHVQRVGVARTLDKLARSAEIECQPQGFDAQVVDLTTEAPFHFGTGFHNQRELLALLRSMDTE